MSNEPEDLYSRQLVVRDIYSKSGVQHGGESEHMTKDRLTSLDKATFKDIRWESALTHLREAKIIPPQGQPFSQEESDALRDLFRSGAQAFGIWDLSKTALEGLIHQVDGTPIVSPALRSWLETPHDSQGLIHDRQIGQVPENHDALAQEAHRKNFSIFDEVHDGHMTFAKGELMVMKFWFVFGVFALSNAYACYVVFYSYSGIEQYFSILIYVARGCGMAIALLTAVLYLSMARSTFKALYQIIPKSCSLLTHVFDAHKEMHMLAGNMMLVAAVAHTLAHCTGTAVGVQRHSPEELNQILGCANPEGIRGHTITGVRFKFLEWPACPLTEKYSYWEVVFKSMPGLTGVLLVVLAFVIGYTARNVYRKKSYDIFWYVHNVAIVAWPLLLFLHGSNAWVGIGFPLVILIAGLPFILYQLDRVVRLIRYILAVVTGVRILEATIRPGKGGGCEGAMTYISVKKPPGVFWRFWSGTYAFISMPEYAPLQWHAFTICSGQESDTVDFLISGIGDWTRHLAQCVLDYEKGIGKLPRIALDGPFMAPTQSALTRKVLVAVGAGVGITPFLSLMATIISCFEDNPKNIPLKEAHFFWMTRSADELLFGRAYFSAICSNQELRDRVFLHLHLTTPLPEKNAAAFLFRESIKRQSKVDQKAFMDSEKKVKSIGGQQMPWCWVNGAMQDVIWLSSLIPNLDEAVEEQLRSKHQGHWTHGVMSTTFNANLRRMVTKVGGRSSQFSAGSGDGPVSTNSNPTVPKPESHISSTTIASRINQHEEDYLLPVVFGRPDFVREIRAIGQAQEGNNVHVYICGNETIVRGIKDACAVCNMHAAEDAKELRKKRQKYFVHYERFG